MHSTPQAPRCFFQSEPCPFPAPCCFQSHGSCARALEISCYAIARQHLTFDVADRYRVTSLTHVLGRLLPPLHTLLCSFLCPPFLQVLTSLSVTYIPPDFLLAPLNPYFLLACAPTYQHSHTLCYLWSACIGFLLQCFVYQPPQANLQTSDFQCPKKDVKKLIRSLLAFLLLSFPYSRFFFIFTSIFQYDFSLLSIQTSFQLT